MQSVVIDSFIGLVLFTGYILVRASRQERQTEKRKITVDHSMEMWEHGAVALIIAIGVVNSSCTCIGVMVCNPASFLLKAGVYLLMLLSYYWKVFDVSYYKFRELPAGYIPAKGSKLDGVVRWLGKYQLFYRFLLIVFFYFLYIMSFRVDTILSQ